MRRISLALFIAVGFMLAVPSSAQAQSIFNTLYEKWFKPPETDQGPKPEETLISPFEEGEMETLLPGEEVPLNVESETIDPANDLSVPHRTDDVLSAWLSVVLTDIFNVDPEGYAAHLEAISPYLTDHAMQQYRLFMEIDGLADYLRKHGYKLAAAVESPPILKEGLYSKGAQNGVYKWEFELPMVLSAFDRNQTNYGGKFEGDRKDITIKMNVVAQITRVAKGGGEHGVFIELLQLPQIDPVKSR